MKSLRTISLVALFGLALMGLTAGSAFAAGTASNTTISNQATLDYAVSGVGQPTVSSDGDGNSANGAQATTFLVDNRLDLTMTGGNNAGASGNNQILIFTVTNTGNTTQGYDLDLFTGTNGSEDVINMSNVRVYIDVNKNGALDGGDTLYAVAGTTNLADIPANAGANSTVQLLVVADTPSGATNGDTAKYSLVATTLNAGTTTPTVATAGGNTSGVDVVLADGAAAAGVGGATDLVTNGKYLATGTYTIQSAQLTVAKGVAVISDPINGAGGNAKAIPGAIVEYTIDITNSGLAAADTLVLTDPIPANTDFYVGSVVKPAAATTSYDNGATTFTYVPVGISDPLVTHVRISIPTVAGSGGTAQVKFRVVIE